MVVLPNSANSDAPYRARPHAVDERRDYIVAIGEESAGNTKVGLKRRALRFPRHWLFRG
jgi:hypothetical protein